MLWSLRIIVGDWKARCIKKPRANIPSEFTATTLLYIRQRACLQAGIKDCGCWNEGERSVTPGENPCQQCPKPGVSMHQFSALVFGQGDSETQASLNKEEKDLLLNKRKRVVRRFASGAAPMQGDDFRKVLANALALRWITPSQTYSIHQNLLELEAASTWLRRFIKKPRAINEGVAKEEMERELKATGEAFLAAGARRARQIMRSGLVQIAPNLLHGAR